MNIKIKILQNGRIPKMQREGDVCYDCYARTEAEIKIPKGKRCLIPLGVALEIPFGYEAVIRPRSGLSKKGIDVAIGTIDSNYRGELIANVINNSGKVFIVKNEDRICQLAIRLVPFSNFIEVDELSDTERGENGFGSSGIC